MNQEFPSEQPPGTSGPELEPEELTDKQREENAVLIEAFGEQFVRLHLSKTWQHREKAMIQLMNWVIDATDLPHGFMLLPTIVLPVEKLKVYKACSLVLLACCQDKIMQVFIRGSQTLKHLFSSCVVKRMKKEDLLGELKLMIPPIVQKLGDSNARTKKAALELLLHIARMPSAGPNFVLDYVVEPVKPPTAFKMVLGRLDVLLPMVKEFKVKPQGALNAETLMGFVCIALKNTNASVRKQAVTLTTAVYVNIRNDIDPLLQGLAAAIKSTLTAEFRKVDTNPEAVDKDDTTDNVEASPSTAEEELRPFVPGKITRDLLVKASKQKLNKGESWGQFFNRLSHLSLQSSQIDKIVNLDKCPNIRVLYLYDNKITQISGLELASSLTHLYLQNNSITKLEGLAALVNLRKLYLDGNSISRLENLEKLAFLEELYISNQKLNADQSFTFDEKSIQSLTNLTVLNVSNNNIRSIAPLQYFHDLERLNLSKNDITDFEEVKLVLSQVRSLKEIDMTMNPITRLPKYREKVIVFSSFLEKLDSTSIRDSERKFLKNLEMNKEKKIKRANSAKKSVAESDSSGSSNGSGNSKISIPPLKAAGPPGLRPVLRRGASGSSYDISSRRTTQS